MLTQALTAIWFFRLFRGVAPVAAGSIAALGLLNAVAIMGSAAALGTAVDLAHASVGEPATGVLTLFLASENLWRAGNLFFGLWLIPMGICALRSGWMPRPLAWCQHGAWKDALLCTRRQEGVLPDKSFLTSARGRGMLKHAWGRDRR